MAGRVAYLAGTRLAVYWMARAMRGGVTAEEFAREYELPLERVRAAMAYAAAYPEEIEDDITLAQANQTWLENQQAAGFALQKTRWQAASRKRKEKAAG